jgi:hypothetical protein
LANKHRDRLCKPGVEGSSPFVSTCYKSSGSTNAPLTAIAATAVSAGTITTRPVAGAAAPTSSSTSVARTSASTTAIDLIYGSSEEDDWLAD